jgi:predicted secreted protein
MLAHMRIATLVIFSLLVAACAGMRDPLRPKTVTADRPSEPIALAHGQRLVVRLPTKPDTGYEWRLYEPLSAAIKPEGPPVAAAGAELWTFTPVRDGEQTLRFEYRRPPDYEARPAESLAYPVTVR